MKKNYIKETLLNLKRNGYIDQFDSIDFFESFYDNNSLSVNLNNQVPVAIEIGYNSNISIDSISRKGWITSAGIDKALMINISKNENEFKDLPVILLKYSGSQEPNMFKYVKIYNMDRSVAYCKPVDNNPGMASIEFDNEVFDSSDSTFDYSDNPIAITKDKDKRNNLIKNTSNAILQKEVFSFNKSINNEGLKARHIYTDGNLFKVEGKKYKGYYDIESNDNKISFKSLDGKKLELIHKLVDKVITKKLLRESKVKDNVK
jgi:hypothetical protein